MCVCLCESMCMTCVWELLQARTVCWIPWNWSHRQLWAIEWILPTESSTRALLTTKSSLQLLCLQFYVILQNTIFKGNLGQSLFPGLYEINLLYSWVCHRWCTFLFFHIPTYTHVFTLHIIIFTFSRVYMFSDKCIELCIHVQSPYQITQSLQNFPLLALLQLLVLYPWMFWIPTVFQNIF